MNKIQPAIFLVPVIAIILVILFYFILLRSVNDKTVFKRFVLMATTFAFALNFAWEIIQLPLYKNNVYDIRHISFCALASVADAIMVLLLFNIFALANKRLLWVYSLSRKQIFLLILIGGIGAVLAERRHLAAGSWAYSEAMPIIPIVEAGLSPVLQFMFLPWLIFVLAARVIKNQPVQ